MLSADYGIAFERMLAEVAAATPTDDLLAPFWPVRGATYQGELLVIGRSVNGWGEGSTAQQLRDPMKRAAVVAALRHSAEPVEGDPMAWVRNQWGATDRGIYNTRRSAFWRVISRLVPEGSADAWPGRLAWTNLYKVSPSVGGNPDAFLQRAQRGAAAELLRQELDQFAPRRVLALTGGWIDPFVEALGLALAGRPGLVEGVGEHNGAAWVVAKHPMTKPEDRFVGEVTEAFAELGRALE